MMFWWGHAHHDHILDAPELCRQTGARLIGSPDVSLVGKAAGLPVNQILSTVGRERIDCGPHCTIQGFTSKHGRVYFNRVTLAGSISPNIDWPDLGMESSAWFGVKLTY